MKQITKLITIISFIVLISSCGKSCPDPSTSTNYVDKGYVPEIIPYSDTSTRLFLKNGKDTLVFRSQGLKETFLDGSTLESECPKDFKFQKFSLKMFASDTDFFDIFYYSSLYNVQMVNVQINKYNTLNEILRYDFLHYYPPVLSQTVLNIKFDSISIIENSTTVVYAKPKVGLIKIISAKNTYELIK
ncbi:MAG: hypothetical protein ACOYMA_12180 [Bacteroidia bacterium]